MGDVGYVDEDGWLFFQYRMGGGIRKNGDFINTAFVEKALSEIDSVNDVFRIRCGYLERDSHQARSR